MSGWGWGECVCVCVCNVCVHGGCCIGMSVRVTVALPPPLQCGEVRQVRLVTFSKGRRKGIAYVEYLDEVGPLHIHLLPKSCSSSLPSLQYLPPPFSLPRFYFPILSSFSPYLHPSLLPPSPPPSSLPPPIILTLLLLQQSAQKAVEELDQHEVDGRKITVAISNPPKRDKRDGAIVAMDTTSSKTAPQRDMPPPSLVPSSV